jgi:hypothetical protein
MAKTPPTDDANERVISLFRDANLPEVPLDVSHMPGAKPATPARSDDAAAGAIDLTGKTKVVMAIGLGATGKTTLLRWACERALERDEGDLALATVDPVNRELAYYFPNTLSPKTQDPAEVTAWLERMLTWTMHQQRSLAVDFGGGDTTLGRLAAEVPDLQQMMEEAGVEPVAVYLLTPRSSDLTLLAAMEQTNFRPKATALVLNIGRSESGKDPRDDFAQVRRHSTYKAVLARGAVEIWMPRLHAAKAVEDRRIGFRPAMNGEAPEQGYGLGPFDRSRVRHWLAAMEDAFAPVSSWLP